MELVLSLLCFVAVSTIFFFVWITAAAASSCGDKSKTKLANNKRGLPPGPWTIPLIGNLHQLLGSGLPHRRMMELSRLHGPLMFLRFGEITNVIVSSAEGAEVVMKTKDLMFATRPRSPTFDIVSCGGKAIIFAPYGDHWRQMRKICIVEILSTKQVKRMESIRTEEVLNLLHSVASSSSSSSGSGVGVANLSKLVAVLANDTTGRAVFGGRCSQSQQREYLSEHAKLTKLLAGFSLVDLFPSSRLLRWLSSDERNTRRSYESIQRIIGKIIGRRMAERRQAADDAASTHDDEDFLDVLLRLQEEDSLMFPLTSETIGAVIFDIFAAGSETSATTLEWAMSELLINPHAMEKAQLEVRKVLGPGRVVIKNTDVAGLQYLNLVIKEVFRLHPPAPLLAPREAREDCEIMGYNIPQGTKIHINAFAICRDPKYWENPQVFQPERFENNNVDYKGTNYEFTPFGAGRRQCPGMLFGTSTVEIALANLLYHFDWALPADGESLKALDMSEKSGIAVSRRYELKLVAIPCG